MHFRSLSEKIKPNFFLVWRLMLIIRHVTRSLISDAVLITIQRSSNNDSPKFQNKNNTSLVLDKVSSIQQYRSAPIDNPLVITRWCSRLDNILLTPVLVYLSLVTTNLAKRPASQLWMRSFLDFYIRYFLQMVFLQTTWHLLLILLSMLQAYYYYAGRLSSLTGCHWIRLWILCIPTNRILLKHVLSN